MRWSRSCAAGASAIEFAQTQTRSAPRPVLTVLGIALQPSFCYRFCGLTSGKSPIGVLAFSVVNRLRLKGYETPLRNVSRSEDPATAKATNKARRHRIFGDPAVTDDGYAAWPLGSASSARWRMASEQRRSPWGRPALHRRPQKLRVAPMTDASQRAISREKCSRLCVRGPPPSADRAPAGLE